MSIQEALTYLLGMIAGVGLYLMSSGIISRNLEAASSGRLKKMFSSVSKNKLIGVAIGALATMLVQSSGATTVMTIGFVNAGIISLTQAATLIFGGEIGTTITGQIVALGLFDSEAFDLTAIFSSLAGFGVFLNMMSKKEKVKRIGDIMSGFGVLFIGLNMMSSSMDAFARMEGLRVFLASVDSVIVLVILGGLITAAIHSSAAMTSIAITMVASGLISLEQGIYITLGANVGTCFTGAIVAMSSSQNAKRTSLIQLVFNTGGVVLLLIADTLLKAFTGNAMSFGIMFERMFPSTPHVQLAMFHTIFNIASVLIVLPLTNVLVETVKKIIPEESESAEGERFYFVDKNMLTTPSVAVHQVKKEIINMAKTAIENFNIAIDIIQTQNYDKHEQFVKNEKQLNFLNKNLVEIIVKLTGLPNLDDKDSEYLTSTYRAISDFERIGDYSENIVEYAMTLKEYDRSFSEAASNEIVELKKLINSLYTITMDIYETDDRDQFAKARAIEEQIDDLTMQMNENHIERLNAGICDAAVGAQYLKLASDAERIGDHLINIIDRDYELSH